jgi:ketol-acid reductoisomerase
MNIALEEDLMQLEEVVVIGYGTQKKESLTGALQGRAAGINIDKSIKVRGTSVWLFRQRKLRIRHG